ncbi:hypothetical protein HBA55_14530 [Pseudomaricurvus alkylphenolicus]|uniref:hemerythrin domain-containing protein n=1 Tax=Pseudomaricurvus alkylphenolicus TaxID=1306991 RepID=UPI0014203398|nr:hemerythrin domain-containing protein [Pseudomaricurvus alkylphenolicus]NIB40814.1 hypothetical protein [Pseudomaricurvus alkylphenolicus]
MKTNVNCDSLSLYSREALPPEIVSTLLSPRREQWGRHQSMLARSQIFFDYHRLLSEESQRLTQELISLLDYGNLFFVNEQTCLNLDQNLKNLLHHTHHHHNIEDQLYFPRLKRQFPQIKRGIDLLDNDHKELLLLLDRIESFDLTRLKPSNRYEQLARLHAEVSQLAAVFPRHFHDEEDLIIPALGKL